MGRHHDGRVSEPGANAARAIRVALPRSRAFSALFVAGKGAVVLLVGAGDQTSRGVFLQDHS
jgi:hypothetical protein